MKNPFVLIWLLTISSLLIGQDVPKVTSKVFIENVTLNTHPGSTPFVGSILVEDGIITNIGPAIQPPFDARVIKGDSMHAYAGFIAPLSHVGLKEPKEDNERPRVERTGYPPNDVAGITPEKSISDVYQQKESSIKAMREQGFTIAHSVPFGRMMPGKGSVISLSGESFDDAVISRDHSLFAQWSTRRGVFPATLIGIMAKWRELYRNAELTMEHTKRYESNPMNRQRPTPDNATKALFPVVNKEMPVFFAAEKHRDIYRTLSLQDDLGFGLVIGEVRDVDRILDRVKKSGARVLLSLDLPEEEKKEKKKEDADSADAPSDGAETQEEKDEEKMQLMKRKEEAVARYVGQAKKLSESGIPVTFSYMDVKPKEIHTSIRRLVKSGLSEADALGALTTQAASTLGIDGIAGTLEPGKVGHMVVLTKPVFDEKAKVKMVIVDGQVHTYEVKEKEKKASGEESPDVSGTWSYKIEVPGMEPSGTMIFTKNGDLYNLEVTSNQNPGETVTAEDIEMDGSTMVFNYSMDAGGMTVSIDSELTFDGNSFEGTVSVADFGSFEITGSKDNPEK